MDRNSPLGGMAAFTAMLVVIAAIAPPSRAASKKPLERTITQQAVGCKTDEALSLLSKYVDNNDQKGFRNAAQKAFASRECELFEPGDKVYVLATLGDAAIQ